MKNEKNEKEKGMKEFERYRYKIRVKVHVASKKFSLNFILYLYILCPQLTKLIILY